MKNKWMAAAAVGIAAWGLSAAAQAAVINRTFDLKMSRFEQVFGSDPTLPPDPVSLNVTLMFDNSANVDTTTTGLTVNAFTLAYGAEFQYFTATDALGNAGFAKRDAYRICVALDGSCFDKNNTDIRQNCQRRIG